MVLEQGEGPNKIQKIIFGPKSKKVLLGLFVGANVIVFGTLYLIKNPQIQAKFLPNVPVEISEDVSAKPTDSVPETEVEPEQNFSDLDALFETLNDEIDAQITNMILSRRNFLLGKAMNKISTEGKTLKYWLVQDYQNIISKMKSQLVERSQKSSSGFGGEFTGKPNDIDPARVLLIDLKAITLALQMIEKEDLTYISPESLTSRVYVGGIINQSAPLTVAIHAKAEEQMWEIVEKNKMRLEAERQAKVETEKALKEINSNGNTSKKDSE